MSVGVVAEEEEEDWEEALEEMDAEATEDGRQERRKMSPMELLRVRKTSSAWQHCCPESFCKNPESFCNKVNIATFSLYLP